VRTETALAQESPYLRQELTRTVGLGDEVITSSGSRFCYIATQSIRGDRNDWNVRERWIGLDAARRLVAIHDRKLDIHQYYGLCFAAAVSASSPFTASIIS
jgi:hypothetical protein